MKKRSLLKTMLLLFALIAGSSSMWAQNQNTWSHAFGLDPQSFKDTSNSSGEQTQNRTFNGVTWTATYSGSVKSGKKYNISGQNVGSKDAPVYRMQIGSSNADMTFSMSASFTEKIKSVSVTAYQTGTGSATMNIDVAGSEMGNTDLSQATHAGATATTYNLTTAKSGTVTISFANNGKLALYVKDIVITFESTPAIFAAGKTMISFSNANYALDFTDANRPAGLKAYQVTAADASSVTLTEVTSAVAKNTGLILTGTAGTTYNIPVVASGTDISASNLLVATDGTSTVSDAAVLSGGEFHPLTSGVIAAGKAYLPYANIEGGDPFTGGAPALNIIFGGETTGINMVKGSELKVNGVYNLAGQRVAQPTKGLYIVNGKKIIIK